MLWYKMGVCFFVEIVVLFSVFDCLINVMIFFYEIYVLVIIVDMIFFNFIFFVKWMKGYKLKMIVIFMLIIVVKKNLGGGGGVDIFN